MKNKSPQWNFTIIELLMVISIIAILACILLPALKTAKDKSMAIDCINHLKQFEIGIVSYAGDYDNWLPSCVESNKYWLDKISGAIDSKASWAWAWQSGTPNAIKKLFECNAGKSETYYGTNYQYNQRIGYIVPAVGYPTISYMAPRKMGLIKNPSRKIHMIDGANKTYTTLANDNNALRVNYIHSKSANILWVDGHVNAMKYETVTAISPSPWNP